jgi:hypothetical protein
VEGKAFDNHLRRHPAQGGQREAAFSRVSDTALDPAVFQQVVATLLLCCASLPTCDAAEMAQCVGMVITV